MSVTITPEVHQHASIIEKVQRRIGELEDEFDTMRSRESEAAANATGHSIYTEEWYTAYYARYDQGISRDEYIDQGLVLSGFAGWKSIGSGCYRHAYMGPDGLVYKIETWGESNKIEASVSERLSGKPGCPKSFRVLDMKLVGSVLVTEYAPRDADSTPCNHHRHPEWGEFVAWVSKHGCGVMDTHEENIWWDGSAFVIIDAGNWSVR